MPKCLIDGKEVEFQPGDNIVDAAKRAGIEIPVFCYHPGLSVVAQCRMCAVEIEKMPKIQTACSTKCAEGMVIKTTSENAKKARSSVMEFLLVNHPLDCPICDKAGECDLQDNSYKWGSPYMRTTEDRRTYVDLDMGPVIKKNMNRCIHCTRCIRFGDEVAGIREMVALSRGNNTEITTIDGKELETAYAGNYADICPTGSLTLKDFRFEKRAWMLTKTPTVCEGCSRGCAIELQHEKDVIYRTIARENMDVNKYWICDEGRFNYNYIQDATRVTSPLVGTATTSWNQAVEAAKDTLKNKKVAILVGNDLTQEEAKVIQTWSDFNLKGAPLLHFGTPGITSVAQDGHEDKILRMNSKTSNLNGLEKLGIKGTDTVPSGFDTVLVFRGGRAKLPDLSKVKAVGIGVFFEKELKSFSAVLPGLAFAEKDGTIVNFQGKEQKLKRAVLPSGKSKSISEALMLWTNLSKNTNKVAEGAITR